MAGGPRIRIDRANQRHHEPEKLPGPNRFRARAIHARFEELSEESAFDRGVVKRDIAAWQGPQVGQRFFHHAKIRLENDKRGKAAVFHA